VILFLFNEELWNSIFEHVVGKNNSTIHRECCFFKKKTMMSTAKRSSTITVIIAMKEPLVEVGTAFTLYITFFNFLFSKFCFHCRSFREKHDDVAARGFGAPAPHTYHRNADADDRSPPAPRPFAAGSGGLYMGNRVRTTYYVE
jgi:hypothetical protein